MKLARFVFPLLLLTATPAFADDESRLDKLFEEARTSISEGNYADACPKLERVLKSRQALGIEHTLADCYVHTDRKADAYDTFMRVALAAKVAGKTDQETSARERAKELEPTIGRLTINLAAAASQLEVTIDDRKVPSDKLGTTIAVDPGHHRLVATAPGRIPFSQELDLDAGGAKEITIPFLEGTGNKADSPFQPVKKVQTDGRGGALRTMGAIATTVGVLGWAGGGILGLLSLSKNDLGNLTTCPDPSQPCADPNAIKIWQDATDLGNASTAIFTISTVFVAGGVLMYLLAPEARKIGWAAPR